MPRQVGIALYNCLFAWSIVTRHWGVRDIFLPWGKGLNNMISIRWMSYVASMLIAITVLIISSAPNNGNNHPSNNNNHPSNNNHP